MCCAMPTKVRVGCEELVTLLCRVGPDASLRIPDLEAVPMKTIQTPVLTAQKAHGVIHRDSGVATVTPLAEACTLPKLNRVRSWKQTVFDPMSNEFPNDIRNHDGSVSTSPIPIKCALGTGDSILQSLWNTPLV